MRRGGGDEQLRGRAHPPTALTFPHRFPNRLSPYRHDPGLAAASWREAGGASHSGRPIRVGALDGLEGVARGVARDLREALGVDAEVGVYRGEEERRARRLLAEKDLPFEWDVLVLGHGAQAADAPPLEMHRAFVGASGEFRAGPVVPEFEALYGELVRRTSRVSLARVANRIDRFVHDEALALFLCAPRALYAVNKHVDFMAHRTSFELPECRVGEGHWSRR